MELTNIQGVLVIKGWDLEPQVLVTSSGHCRLFLQGMNSGTFIPRMGFKSWGGWRGGGGSGEKEEEEIPYKYEEAPGEGGNSDIMGWRPQEWRGGTREERCEGGSLVDTCAGSRVVWGETEGLLAWVLVEAQFSTWMIITQCQLHILLGNCTYVFGIFL